MNIFKVKAFGVTLLLTLVACSDEDQEKSARLIKDQEAQTNPSTAGLAKRDKCALWANTYDPSNERYMINNNYGSPEGAELCHFYSNENQWGSSWDHNGLTGGMAGQIQIGKWPWSEINTAKSGLPAKVSDSDGFISEWEFEKTIISGEDWNMFWEIWLHKDSTAEKGSNITLDLMIHPTYGHKGGKKYGEVEFDGVKWEVYKHQHPAGFPLVHYYRIPETDKPGKIKLSNFWNDSIARGWGNSGDWVGSITAGQESFSGAGSFQTTKWKVYNEGVGHRPSPPKSNLVDTAKDFSKVEAYSPNLRIEKHTSFSGDKNQFQRTDDKLAFVSYQVGKATNILVDIIGDADIQSVKIFASKKDRLDDWVELDSSKTRSSKTDQKDWHSSQLTADLLDYQGGFVKLLIAPSEGKWWKPLIANVLLQKLDVSTENPRDSEENTVNTGKDPDYTKCALWANTYDPSNERYMINNNYGSPEGAELCHFYSNENQWGSSWDHNGLTGGMAGQIQIGKWPWSEINTAKSGLPAKVSDSDGFVSEWEFEKTIISGEDWNMFWEIWLHKDSTAEKGSNITLDLMIHPTYGHKGGKKYGEVEFDGVKWEVYKHQHPAGFPLVHYYRIPETDKPGKIKLSSFWNDSIARGWGNSGDWVGSITAGQESFSGAGSFQTTKWKVYNEGVGHRPSPPQANLVDTAKDFSKVEAYSPNLRIEKHTSFSGDKNQFQRTDDKLAFVSYQVGKATNILVDLIGDADIQSVKIFASKKGRLDDWVELDSSKTRSSKTDQKDWHSSQLTADLLDYQGGFVKLLIAPSEGKWWKPLIANVLLQKLDVSTENPRDSEENTVNAGKDPDYTKCALWANTYDPSNERYMINNNYGSPEGAELCHFYSNENQWGSSWDHNGLTGGMAGQIQIGKWPWSEINTAKSGLPAKVSDSDGFVSEWEFEKTIISGEDWNMFWEIWLHKDSTAEKGSNITLDLMIHPTYGHKGGKKYGEVEFDGVKWEVYKHQHPAGFPLVHYYRIPETDKPGKIKLSNFWNDSIARGWGNSGDWVGSITAGQESFSGAGSFQTTKWKVYNE